MRSIPLISCALCANSNAHAFANELRASTSVAFGTNLRSRCHRQINSSDAKPHGRFRGSPNVNKRRGEIAYTDGPRSATPASQCRFAEPSALQFPQLMALDEISTVRSTSTAHGVPRTPAMSVFEEAAQIFRKEFAFRRSSAWRLPDPSHLCSETEVSWQLPSLQQMKAELNTTKSLLNEMEPIAWRRHTTWTNRAGSVMHKVRQSASPELLTQAWCKFYQLLHDYDLARADPLRSFHLCEAPGAFVLALQHYLHSMDDRNSGDNWTWFANTLNPYYEGNEFKSTVTDDRLIFATLPQWYFGQDQTGDVMSRDFRVECFLESRGDSGEFDLVTADGSVDCQDDPAEQEATVSTLHSAEALAAFKLLADGGNLVLKMFTFFERPSVCLLYILNCVFRQVHVKKPACSKPGNSEVYVVCTSFKKEALTSAHLAALTQLSVKDAVASLYIERYGCRQVAQPPLPLSQGQVFLRFRGWNVASFAERNGRSDWWKEHTAELRKLLNSIQYAALHKPDLPEGAVPGLSKFCAPALLDLALMLGLADSVDSASDVTEGLDRTRVVFVNCREDNASSAKAISSAVSELDFGKQLVVRFRETLSRFSVGVLYLLSCLFSTTSVVFSKVPGMWPLWTFGDVDVERADELLKYFAEIAAVEVEPTLTVLEVVPLPILCHAKFSKFVKSVNDSVLHKFVAAVLDTADGSRNDVEQLPDV
ncbi:hypothetical protein HPB48_025626 [Haemaphysalis longicornis]|uniref:Cap-specific mRNA (nucleoside-2'-O-)-methyltransferase 2 n=1 Tax=Haemaphysalis longicornis TaxID=44386 RepID=A0A9J6HAC0_HAELO|nr:hypothetical protein HPB48_025626 [Haemaphysalis longicornis]